MSSSINELKPDPNAPENIGNHYSAASDALEKASHSATEVSEHATDALLDATAGTAELIESLSAAAINAARDAAKYIRREANKNPRAALATAAAAIVTLTGVVTLIRRGKRLPQ